MKRYTSEQSLSYHVQNYASRDLNQIFDGMLTKIGGDLMKQIYNDLPELFSQKNFNDLGLTKYKAELYVITQEEALLLNQIKRRMAWHGEHIVTQEQLSQT
jgi:hypothetical protein